MGGRPRHRIHDKGLHELDLFSLQKTRLKGDLSAVCDHLMRGNRETEGASSQGCTGIK